MGKKITLDFSKVEERSGWNSKEMPEGLHEFKIELVDLKDANDGTPMWTYGLRPTNAKYKTRLFPYYCKHQANQMFKIRDIYVAAGLTVPKKKVGLDPDAPVGKIIAAEVSDSSNANYQGRSEIDGVYDRSIIEDDDQVDDEEVEDEDVDEEAEEVEDDEEFEEEGDEEEVDEEELREELEALTLGLLRKRAKGLEIDTEGVSKKDLIEMVIEEELGEVEEEAGDDEDDLDDEDLEDEELEDEEFEDEEEEEEEPEPAPRRRAAPVKKAPAKAAAKAAPARRVVKRR